MCVYRVGCFTFRASVAYQYFKYFLFLLSFRLQYESVSFGVRKQASVHVCIGAILMYVYFGDYVYVCV